VKAVVHSQREARGMGDEAVAPHHLLLGLVAEDRSAAGFLAPAIRIERAREACRAALGKRGAPQPQAATGLATDVPFSAASKRVFVAAVEFSRNMGCNFISPDHIALGLVDLDDPTTNNILKRLVGPHVLVLFSFSPRACNFWTLPKIWLQTAKATTSGP
jgi:ATP-dependent Clp protease ATP-binding subunit ClpC